MSAYCTLSCVLDFATMMLNTKPIVLGKAAESQSTGFNFVSDTKSHPTTLYQTSPRSSANPRHDVLDRFAAEFRTEARLRNRYEYSVWYT